MTDAVSAAPDGWASWLDPDERILWQGRPHAGIRIGPQTLLLAAFGLAFAGFALVWMAMAPGLMAAFGLIHLAAGLGVVAGAVLWGPFRRRHSVYSLSSRRAFIATDLPLQGRRLRSFPIGADAPIDFEPGPLSSIWFATETRRGSKGRSHEVKIGFERIPDGEAVLALIRQIQRGAA